MAVNMAWHEVTQFVSKCVYEFKKQMEKRQEHQLNMVLGNFSKLQEEVKLLRDELDCQKARAPEQREFFHAEVQALKHRLQEVQDSNDEARSDMAEALRLGARAETATLSCRSDIQVLEDSVHELRSAQQDLQVSIQGELDGKTVAIKPNEELEDMRRRLAWLEEHVSKLKQQAAVEVKQIRSRSPQGSQSF
eukprot:symbB.v1.2.014498.t1/scaffold1061.1/size140413/4